jgi:predicted nucleic acid-binding protein
MGEVKYLIDTNAVIDYLAQNMPESANDFMNGVINSIPNISIITKIELLGFNASAEHISLLTSFVGDALVFDLTSSIADLTISIRREHKTKLPDAIIAATAIVNGMKLITRNTSDFTGITGLQVLNPFNV